MSVLGRIVSLLKVWAKSIGINAISRHSPARPTNNIKYSKPGKPLRPLQNATGADNRESRFRKLDNQGESSDHHEGVLEDQNYSKPFDGKLPSTVTEIELDASGSLDSIPNTVSSDFDENHQSPSHPEVIEEDRSDESIQPPIEYDQSDQFTHNTIAESHQIPNDLNFDQSPSVARESLKKPREISGRRSRVPSTEIRKPQVSRRPQPELFCYKNSNGGAWEVGVYVDEKFPIKTVFIEKRELCVMNNECQIPLLTGRLSIEYQDGMKQDVSLFEGKPLIFKLRKNWAGNGRKVTAITNGCFIVIAPIKWNRRGHTPVKPEFCQDTGFHAHYFSHSSQSHEGHISGFDECEEILVTMGIKLKGQHVFDDSEEGLLFVQSAPELITTREFEWARVGEEADSGWKGQNFKPAEQSLSDILNGREGRFFLRVYDSSTRLLDSTEFRFLKCLKQILVNGEAYTKHTILLPEFSGHTQTEVCFVGTDDSKGLQPRLQGDNHSTLIEDVLIVDQTPEANSILCVLGSDRNEVVIKLNLPRTWWKIMSADKPLCNWRDKPFKMTRQEFQEQANNESVIVLMQKQLQSTIAGFDDKLDLKFRSNRGDTFIEIPLIDFVDHVEIDQRLSADAHFNVEIEGKVLPLIVISADPMPKIKFFNARPTRIQRGEEATLRWNSSDANQAQAKITPLIGDVECEGSCTVSPFRTTVYTLSLFKLNEYSFSQAVTVNVDCTSRPKMHLQPQAQRHDRSGWKNAKGFSYNEIKGSGLNLRDAQRLSIKIDKRRQTVHQINMQALKILLNE